MARMAEDYPEESPRSRIGAIAAAVLAVAAAAGLGWWASRPDHVAPDPAPLSTRPSAAAVSTGPVRYAAEEPDRAAIRAAFDQVREVYGDGGPPALVQASEDCARRLPGEPTRLDYCLAFDMYAADILPAQEAQGGAGAWFHDADARAIALAGAALPAFVSAEGRVAQVRALTLAAPPKAARHRRGIHRAKAKAKVAAAPPHVAKVALVRAPPRAPRSVRHRKDKASLEYGVVRRPPSSRRAAEPETPGRSEDPPL